MFALVFVKMTPDNEGVSTIRNGIFEVDCIWKLSYGVNVHVGREGVGGGVDGDVGAVSKGFLRSAAHAFSSVIALAPRVSGVVRPL